MMYVLIAIGLIVILLFANTTKSEHTYTASFGNDSEHLSFFNQGFAIGQRAFTKKLSCTNMLLCGPTGSGKSSISIIPTISSLAKGRSSIVVNDVSGELWLHASQYLAEKGYTVLRLDFSNPQQSETFNPLLECNSVQDIQKTALLIVRNAMGGESKGDPFWEQSSIMLLSLFMRYLVFNTPPEYRTLQNTLLLIETFAVNGTLVDKLFVATNDQALLSAYKSTLSMGDKTLASVIATARTSLHLFTDLEVCKTTASNSINFKILREKPVVIFVCNPLKDLRYFKPISALFFQALFNFILSSIPDRNARHIYLLMDEFASMKFPDMAVIVSNIRKYKAGLLICVQDEMSLISQYGQAEAHQLKTNCGIQCFLKGTPLHTAKELSQILGRYTYTDEHNHEKVRELMTPDEIRLAEAAIVLVNNHPPLKFTPTPFYESIWMRKLVHASGYSIPLKEAQNPPLLTMQ